MKRSKITGAVGGLAQRTQICTSLAAPTTEQLRAKAYRAISGGTDLVEFRLDFLRGPESQRLKTDLGEFADRAIFTLRRSDEGGAFSGRESERLTLLEECADIGPAFLDVELRTLNANPRLARTRLGRRKIVSWHGRSGTPGTEKLALLATAAAAHGGIPKIIPVARKGADNLAVLSLYDRPGLAPIAFCAGQAGVFSRVMAIGRRTPVAYASLDGEETARGQLQLRQALAVRRIFAGA